MVKSRVAVGDMVRYGINTGIVIAVKGRRVQVEIIAGVTIYQGTQVWVRLTDLTALVNA